MKRRGWIEAEEHIISMIRILLRMGILPEEPDRFEDSVAYELYTSMLNYWGKIYEQ